MLGSESSPKLYVAKILALILLNNNPNTLFGNAMFEFFVKHAVCNRSVWVFANKRRVNTVSSNSVFYLNIAAARPSVLTFCRADLLCLYCDEPAVLVYQINSILQPLRQVLS
jgi:hypothetical protein